MAQPRRRRPSRPRARPQPGDRFTSHNGTVHITVGETDPGGQWAMIHCVIYCDDGETVYHEWDKQQPAPGGVFSGRSGMVRA
jgi:hypothetical protein